MKSAYFEREREREREQLNELDIKFRTPFYIDLCWLIIWFTFLIPSDEDLDQLDPNEDNFHF